MTISEPIQTILVVDDSAMARRMMGKVIKELLPDAEIIQAPEAEAGRAAWLEHRPDLAIFDLNMPGESGLELAARIKSEDPGAAIILCTANVQQATQDRVRELGIEFIAKPVNPDKLRAVLALEAV